VLGQRTAATVYHQRFTPMLWGLRRRKKIIYEVAQSHGGLIKQKNARESSAHANSTSHLRWFGHQKWLVHANRKWRVAWQVGDQSLIALASRCAWGISKLITNPDRGSRTSSLPFGHLLFHSKKIYKIILRGEGTGNYREVCRSLPRNPS
jgi:hypothetical protein